MMLNRLQTYHIMSMLWSQGKIQNEKLFLDVLSTLLKRVSERDLKDVDKCGCLKVLCDKIQNLSSPKCISICFQILEDMATCESAKDKIRKNGGINAVCVLFNKWSQTEVRNKVIKTLKSLKNIYNRDIIKEYMENTDKGRV
ncbi:hypothetical protein LSH36_65g06040 [Paralvinella palmiformis]|uniref:Uncharacterized protein n=1 Tax=Paralvinella palmiformis TaxID=53620 RepID=A0AAD9K5G4_9ANNE|nr:hypothetical protein LSH36_65g06040 [Paralvinella palmiformis]